MLAVFGWKYTEDVDTYCREAAFESAHWRYSGEGELVIVGHMKWEP